MPSYESDVSIYTIFVTHLEYMNHRLIAFIYFWFEGKKGKTERTWPFGKMRMFKVMKKRVRSIGAFYHG